MLHRLPSEMIGSLVELVTREVLKVSRAAVVPDVRGSQIFQRRWASDGVRVVLLAR